MPNLYRKNCGIEGEDVACAFLEQEGFTILERNYYAGKKGEIDLIARRENLVLFAEVKKRNSDAFGGGIYSITQNKKKALRRSAEYYLVKNSSLYTKDLTYRFDLILVEGGKVECIEDILR